MTARALFNSPKFAGAGSLVLAALVAIASLASSQVASQGPAAQEPPSDPRLATPLMYLRGAVTQRPVPGSQLERDAIRARLAAGQVPKIVADALRTRMMVINQNAEVQVYIECESLDAANLTVLENLGVRIELKGGPDYRQKPGGVFRHVPTLQAEIPIEVIQQVESLPFIRFIRLPDYAAQSSGSSTTIGSITTQGDSILQASAVRSQMNVSGSGVRVGVISSGIAGIFAANCTTDCPPTSASPSPMALGDVPMGTGTRNASGALISVTPIATSTLGSLSAPQSFLTVPDLEATVNGQGQAEGTAMLEIVHHLAPGAALTFANASTGMEFENAVNALAQINDIVVDDRYFMESSFDGASPVSLNTADALNNDSNPIRAYITSGGNLALDHYMGTWSNSNMDGSPYTSETGDLHQFLSVLPANATADSPATTDAEGFSSNGMGPTFDPVVVLGPNDTVTVSLAWNDPLNASSNDYDLFLVQLSCPNSTAGPGALPTPPCTMMPGPPLEKSENRQTGTQDPYESLAYSNGTSSNEAVGIVIQNYNNMASPVIFDMFVGGTYAKANFFDHNFNTVASSVPAQSDSGGSPASVISVAAINQNQCLAPGNCAGQVEKFSSEGPTQATPQNASMGGGAYKPNLVAVDGVCITGANGFGAAQSSPNECVPNPDTYTPQLFFGTSAAAPHVAGIAALMLNMAPCLLQNGGSQTPKAERIALYEALTGALPGYPSGSAPLPLDSAAPSYPFANALSGYYYSVPNQIEGYGLVNALASATGLLLVPPALTITSQSATTMSSNTSSNMMAEGFVTVNEVLSSGTTPGTVPTNFTGCPVNAIQWTSPQCTSGSASGTEAVVECPAGVNSVSVNVSVNGGTSYLPQSEVTPATAIVTDFSITATPYSTPPVIVAGGTPVLFEVLVASSPQGGFTNPVSLACTSGLPAGAQCMFSPITVTPSTATSSLGTASSTLTIYTPGVAQLKGAPGSTNGFARGLPVVFAAGFLILGLSSRKRKANYYGALWGAVVLTGLGAGLCVVSCGSSTKSSSSKTAIATSYAVTITGTSNQVAHSTTVSFQIE